MALTEFDFTSIDGKPLPLRDFSGKAVLVVNTASQCGFTPQYAGLQQLHERFHERGLVVLGVPSNDFGQQEPAGEEEIKGFCEARFGVTFPLTSKQKVIGGEAHPLYRWIAAELGENAAPRWNFHKYLFDRQGEIVNAWPSKIAPMSPEIVRAVEETLG